MGRTDMKGRPIIALGVLILVLAQGCAFTYINVETCKPSAIDALLGDPSPGESRR